jgi:Ca2+-binding RTX toxin-like protein
MWRCLAFFGSELLRSQCAFSLPSEGAKTMRGRNRFFSFGKKTKNRICSRRNSRPKWLRSARWFESLERRALLTADIAITGFTADGTDLKVDYDITGANVAAFNVSLYASSNGTTLGQFLVSERVTNSADLQVGTGHQFTFTPFAFFASSVDFYFVAVVDSSNEISEDSESNNQLALTEGLFQTANGVLYVNGSSAGDNITISDSSTLDVEYNSANYSYTLSAITTVCVLSHGGDDLVDGAGTSKVIWTNTADGNDTIYGGSGNDTIKSGAGNDTIYGGAGNDGMWAGDGNDILAGQAGNDAAYGEAGDDTIYVGSGGDGLYGGAGSDLYIFEADVGDNNSDTILEGANADVDTLDFSSFAGAYSGNMNLNMAYSYSQVVITGKARVALMGESNIENVICGDGNDYITGNSRANVIHGGAGNDTLLGDGGADSLYGQAGNDVLEGGAANDYLDGGANDDTYRFWGNYDLGTDTIAEAAGNGTDMLDFSNASVSCVNIDLSLTGSYVQGATTYLDLILSNANALENVKGTAGADHIIGNDLSNTIYGLGDDDWIEGGVGDDTLYGGDGNDIILGLGGNDAIYGGSGDDALYGDDGYCDCSTNDADWIYGEDGNDYLEGNGDDDYLNGGSGIDDFGYVQPGDFVADRPVITDFDWEIVEGDLLVISGHVDDDSDLEGLTIHFGGALEGYTATVDENGDFELVLEEEEVSSGTATATITDWEGLQSEEGTIIL